MDASSHWSEAFLKSLCFNNGEILYHFAKNRKQLGSKDIAKSYVGQVMCHFDFSWKRS